ncbi:MAG: hypothetical protein KC897_10395 [Candidatus Omnitrophica bacterium]|nr:hypothetical protein [Candidatus Omnitrophota bacterium]MCB9719259.1 hypothetical protein [Candidatus Omnitrophota bacterium]
MKSKSLPLWIISAVFVVSRLIVFACGVRFDIQPLYSGIQLADPVLLKTRLWETLYYLHGQPPLFNLFVGSILKLFPDNHLPVFHALFIATGYLLAVGFYRLLRCFDIPRGWATALVCHFMINPAVILLENWLFYTYFILAMLVWLAVFLHRFLRGRRTRDLVAVMWMMGVLVGTKSTFHILWFALIWAGAFVILRKEWKRLLVAGIVPFVLIAALYAKNFYVFRSMTTSRAWMAFNLLEMSAKMVRPEKIDELFEQGVLKSYPGAVANKSGIPVLDDLTKPSSGEKNWHSLLAWHYADIDLENTRYLLKHFPESYRYSVSRAYLMYFFPGPTDVTFPNRRYIAAYENGYHFMFRRLNTINDGRLYTEKLLLWHSFDRMKWDDWGTNMYAMVVMFYIGSLLAALGLAAAECRRRPENLPFILTIFFMAFNILYLTTGSNLFAWIGANRYRFVLEPYYLTMFAVAVVAFLRRQHRPRTGEEARSEA